MSKCISRSHRSSNKWGETLQILTSVLYFWQPDSYRPCLTWYRADVWRQSVYILVWRISSCLLTGTRGQSIFMNGRITSRVVPLLMTERSHWFLASVYAAVTSTGQLVTPRDSECTHLPRCDKQCVMPSSAYGRRVHLPPWGVTGQWVVHKTEYITYCIVITRGPSL